MQIFTFWLQYTTDEYIYLAQDPTNMAKQYRKQDEKVVRKYNKIPILRTTFEDCPKVALKTTFGQSQRWSLIRGTLCVENEEKNNFNFTNKVFNRQDVLILSGRNSGISL